MSVRPGIKRQQQLPEVLDIGDQITMQVFPAPTVFVQLDQVLTAASTCMHTAVRLGSQSDQVMPVLIEALRLLPRTHAMLAKPACDYGHSVLSTSPRANSDASFVSSGGDASSRKSNDGSKGVLTRQPEVSTDTSDTESVPNLAENKVNVATCESACQTDTIVPFHPGEHFSDAATQTPPPKKPRRGRVNGRACQTVCDYHADDVSSGSAKTCEAGVAPMSRISHLGHGDDVGKFSAMSELNADTLHTEHIKGKPDTEVRITELFDDGGASKDGSDMVDHGCADKAKTHAVLSHKKALLEKLEKGIFTRSKAIVDLQSWLAEFDAKQHEAGLGCKTRDDLQNVLTEFEANQSADGLELLAIKDEMRVLCEDVHRKDDYPGCCDFGYH